MPNGRSPLTLDDYGHCLDWTLNGSINSLAFHFIATICPNETENASSKNLEASIEAPATFFVQIFRLGLSVTFIVIILALYNSIDVLGRTIFSVASCSLHWVIFFILILIKSLSLIVFVPVLTSLATNNNNTDAYNYETFRHIIHNQKTWNMVGFIFITFIQTLTVFALFCSLEHEFKFRTHEQASVEAPLNARCQFLKRWRLYVSIPKSVMIICGIISLFLLMSIEIVFHYSENNYCHDGETLGGTAVATVGKAPKSLIGVWLASVLLLRVGVLVIGIGLLFIRHESLRLTIPAKFYLVFGLLLSIGEDIPNSILTLSRYHYEEGHTLDTCFGYITAYDVVQITGGISLIFFLLFVRSQYLRVEQESKLSLVWDMQRLLQVNGRRDVRNH